MRTSGLQSKCEWETKLWEESWEQKPEWDTFSVWIRNKHLKLDTHFPVLCLFDFIPCLHKTWPCSDERCSCESYPLFFSCDGLSFGLGLPGTVCSTLTAWEVKPAWSLAFTRSSVSLPHWFESALHISVPFPPVFPLKFIAVVQYLFPIEIMATLLSFLL